MKKYFLLCLFLTLTAVSGYSKTRQFCCNYSNNCAVSDFSQVNLKLLVTEINGYLPMPIDFELFELKQVEFANDLLKLYLKHDENIRGNWGTDSDEYIGQYIIAAIVTMPEVLETVSQMDQKDIAEMRKKQSFAKALDSPIRYQRLSQLIKKVKDENLAVQLYLHSRDGYRKTINLDAESVKDAVIFSHEVLEKVATDNTAVF